MAKIEKLLEYLKESPGDAFLNHAYALELIKAGDHVQAEETFRSLLQRNPDYLGSYYHLAKLIERKGNYEEAVQWYEKGMELAKATGDKHAYNELQMAKEEIEE